ncbi:MAG: O-antigen ligase family protein [Terracidiphilus sp.]
MNSVAVKPAYTLVVFWTSLVPLVYFASNGRLWFQSAADNNALSSQYGSLVTQSQKSQNLAVTAVVFTIVLALLLPKLTIILQMLRKDVVFGALVGLSMASSLWSQFPERSLQWSMFLALDTAFIFYLHQRFTHEQTMQLLFLVGWVCLVVSIILALCFPAFGIDHTLSTPSWRGLYGQKNLCAMATVFWLSLAFYLPARSFIAKSARAVYICLSVALIVMTRSTTSDVVLGVLVAYVLATRMIQRFQFRDRIVTVLAASIAAISLLAAMIVNWTELAYLLGKDPTLTGRIGIWQAAWTSLMKHPLLGYGYRAFWEGYQGESANVALANGWAVTSAHNAFLGVWLDLGALGLAVVVYSLVRAVSQVLANLCTHASSYLGWCACIVFLTIVMSIDEGEMMIPNGLLWMLFMLASLGLLEKNNNA